MAAVLNECHLWTSVLLTSYLPAINWLVSIKSLERLQWAAISQQWVHSHFFNPWLFLAFSHLQQSIIHKKHEVLIAAPLYFLHTTKTFHSCQFSRPACHCLFIFLCPDFTHKSIAKQNVRNDNQESRQYKNKGRVTLFISPCYAEKISE